MYLSYQIQLRIPNFLFVIFFFVIFFSIIFFVYFDAQVKINLEQIRIRTNFVKKAVFVDSELVVGCHELNENSKMFRKIERI